MKRPESTGSATVRPGTPRGETRRPDPCAWLARLRHCTLALLAAVLLAALPQPDLHAQTTPSTGSTQSAAGPAKPERPMSPDKVERMKKLSEELRCLVCQNQTLADSAAGLALDLRHQVEDLIMQGKSDDEIKDYLVQRYGDFVLYRPQVKNETYVLWFGPFALLLIGGIAWIVVQRRSSRQASQAQAVDSVGDQERDRARKLLDS
jgi:cytochrome c-type biogenesis protein CcmH